MNLSSLALISVVASLPISTEAIAQASNPATQLSCNSAEYVVQCSAKDVCAAPPPGVHREVGTSVLTITHGSGFDEALGAVAQTYNFDGKTLLLTAKGGYSVNQDGSVYLPRISLEMTDVVDRISIASNGDTGVYAWISAAIKSKAADDGSYKLYRTSISCMLQ